MNHIKSVISDIRSTWGCMCYMLGFFRLADCGKSYILLMSIYTVLSSLIPLAYMIIPGVIINELTGGRDMKRIIIYVALLVIAPIAIRLNELTFHASADKKERRVRRALGNELQSYIADIDYKELENPRVCGAICEMTYNAPGAPVDMLSYVLNLLGAIVGIVPVASVMIYLNPAVVIVLLIIIFVNASVTNKINGEKYGYQIRYRALNNIFVAESNNLGNRANGKEIRLFGIKDFLLDRYGNACKAIKANTDEQERKEYGRRSIHAVTRAVQELILYSSALYRVINGGLSIGFMTIFISAAGSFSGYIGSIFNAYLNISSYKPHADDIKKFRSMGTPYLAEGKNSPEFGENSVIEFKNVSFKYPGSKNFSLHNLNIKFKCGEKLCIVGENGSGKSTFIKLLTRLYEPIEGEILLDGENIKEFDIRSYQKLFAPVFQDFSLYQLPLALNIALEENYDTDRTDAAIKETGLNDLVKKLSRGRDTYVGKSIDPEGFEPSGGEGQRIAIARALYRGSPVYILDEPTAALDPIQEYEIYTQFNTMTSGHTAVFVTHRMSAVKLSDVIAVFADGHVAEYGTHAELYAKGGIYTEMFDKQAHFYREADGDNI